MVLIRNKLGRGRVLDLNDQSIVNVRDPARSRAISPLHLQRVSRHPPEHDDPVNVSRRLWHRSDGLMHEAARAACRVAAPPVAVVRPERVWVAAWI